MASFCCYDNSDVIATLIITRSRLSAPIITNFHLYPRQLWWQFFQIFDCGDVRSLCSNSGGMDPGKLYRATLKQLQNCNNTQQKNQTNFSLQVLQNYNCIETVLHENKKKLSGYIVAQSASLYALLFVIINIYSVYSIYFGFGHFNFIQGYILYNK